MKKIKDISINEDKEEQKSLSQVEENRAGSYDFNPMVKSMLEGRQRR